ncbi:putative metallopeptidase [Paenibacillus cymbidii]|uniref:putative metallopeptidase n=1 Tax=Paenibacillus cymbidii TaxID=1639034 RepID=UPI0010816CE4|nr:putative metallopeptidase [Paenibacillus cymbidii]
MARAPKRDKFHTEADRFVYERLGNVIADHHKDLSKTEFLILMKHGGWRSKGKTVFAKMKVLGDDFRRTLKKDVVLYLNADMWGILTAQQKNYVLDHQLYTLDTATDRHGSVKRAMDGRPMLTTVPHDFEGFREVVRRHGIVMDDIKNLMNTMVQAKQITIEEAAAAAVEQSHEQSAPPAELDDPNQTTLDQALKDAGNGGLDMDAEIANAGNVADIGQARSARKSKKDKEAAAAPESSQPDATGTDDDDLPF